MIRLLVLIAFLLLGSATVFAQGGRETFNDTPLTIYRIDLKEQKLQLVSTNSQGGRLKNAAALEELASEHMSRLLFATNSGIFDTSFSPLGLYIEEGRELTPLNTARGEGNFYLQPNGVFYIENGVPHVVETSHFKKVLGISIATQSGPLLVLDGKTNPAFTPGSSNRYVRSGVGVCGGTQVVFAISDTPINLFDFASFFRTTLKCSSALYLDGAISKMYVADLDRRDTGGSFAAMFALFEKPFDLFHERN